VGFLGFIGGAEFGGYYFFLRRALRELDPGRAIPERVKAAFDTLAEGELIRTKEGTSFLRTMRLSKTSIRIRNLCSASGSVNCPGRNLARVQVLRICHGTRASLTGAAREIADLVKQADEALYSAKSLGQNRFVNWNKMPGRTESVGLP